MSLLGKESMKGSTPQLRRQCMRRTLAVVACVVILLGLAPAAFAQAPAPKVTITGLFDQVTSAGKNLYDGNFSRSSESEWYARTRFRPDFSFEVGRTKAVLGLEIDLGFGQAGANDGGFPGNTSGTQAHKAGSPSLDLNTDIAGSVEVKWIYTEFDLTGKDSLMPFIPVSTVARVGGQPFATLAGYKVAYANGDFGGISTRTNFAPNLRLALAFVQVEEELAIRGGGRGDDFAIIISPEFTPFKGLDIKPLYSYFYAQGSTSGAARRAVSNAQGAVSPTEEDRHTIGVDARWRSGNLSIDPTIYYQFGSINQRGAGSSDISALFIDLQGGYQFGPLLLEWRTVFTTGNEAGDNLLTDDRNYFQPLDLDSGYWAGWSNIQALGVDYFNGGSGFGGGNMATAIGYDRYGRRGVAVRATYSLTPALAFYGIVSPTWSHEKVDTDTTSGATRGAPTGGGDDRYIGTEADLGMTWRFAPNTAFDLVGAYLLAGPALDTVDASGQRDAQNAWTVAARVRLSF
jgi:hypothetical protein